MWKKTKPIKVKGGIFIVLTRIVFFFFQNLLCECTDECSKVDSLPNKVIYVLRVVAGLQLTLLQTSRMSKMKRESEKYERVLGGN